MTSPRPPAVDTDALIDALPASLAALARRGALRRYRKGSIVIEEGDPGGPLFVILAGRLRAYSIDPKNDNEIIYGSYGAGEYVGELGLDGGPRTASVMALEPSVCAMVTRHSLLAHIGEHPEFAFELLAKLTSRARAATMSLKRIALNDVYGRLKLLLEAMCGVEAREGWIAVERVTHRELAGRIGCSREMVSRVLKDLEKGGYLRVEGGVLRVRLPLAVRW